MSQNNKTPHNSNHGSSPSSGQTPPGWGVPNRNPPRDVQPKRRQPIPEPQQPFPRQPLNHQPNNPYPPHQYPDQSGTSPQHFQHLPPQPNQSAQQSGLQLPVPVNYGAQPQQPVQYVIMPHPTYWGQSPQQAVNMISAEEQSQARRWRRFLSLLSLLALAMLGLVWYSYSQGNLLAEPFGDEALVAGALPQNITVEARIQPARQAALSYPIGGIIGEMFVEEGQVVEAGQPLLSLDNSRQIVSVAQAQANLEQAEARLQELETGARTQEIIAAQAATDAAQARYDGLTAAVSAENISAAEAQLAAAQAALDDLLGGPDPNAAIEAKAELQAAEAAVSRAQSAYNQVKWRNDIAMLPESQALQEATTALEAARARSNQRLQGASVAEISQARALVKEAEAELQRVRNPVAQGDIDAAAAELRSAEATLELVQSGNRSEVVAFAQAEVSAAKATLLEADVALQETQLVAPYSGIVVELQADVGEFVNPGTPVLQFGDLSTLKFETELSDGDAIRQIDEGMPVLIKVEELGDLAMTGKVTTIKEDVTSRNEGIYTIFVEPDEVDERLTWKMRSQIFFQFE